MKKAKKKSLRLKIVLFDTLTTFFSLILCTIILLVFSSRIITDYIQNDLVFLLEGTNNKLNIKTVLVEDTLLAVRKNKTIMNYLDDVKFKRPLSNTFSSIEDTLKSSVNIYSSKNTYDLPVNFIASVYLYDYDGTFYKTHYNEPLKNKKVMLDKKYGEIYKSFKASDQDVAFFTDDEHIVLVYTLYSHLMEDVGTLLFVLNKQAIASMMNHVNRYSNSFWFVFDKYGQILLGDDIDRLSRADIDNIMTSYHNASYTVVIGNTRYLLHTSRMSMNINCTVAIPSNSVFQLLYETLEFSVYTIIIMTLIIIVFTFAVIYKMTRPLKIVASKIQLVSKDQFETKLPDFKSKEFHNISVVFNEMTDRIHYLINDVYEKQLMLKETDLKFLQSQMNPHFMFNVLNTIALKAKMDHNEDIYIMLTRFSQLIQSNIYHDDNEKVRIKEELKYVDFYLFLQSYRFGDKLRYAINVSDEGLLALYIPRLCIQLIVENAVVHGLEPKADSGEVNVNIFCREETVVIDVIDNGVGFDTDQETITLPIRFKQQDEHHNRIGLNNAYRIIQYFYGTRYGITIKTKKNAGTRVRIEIPFDRRQVHVQSDDSR